jgi:hypothetical protein
VTEDHAERLRTLEATVAEIRVRQTQMESLLEQQVATARQIKSDTEEIVSLIKGANVLARVAKWLAVVVGGYLAGKGMKWW